MIENIGFMVFVNMVSTIALVVIWASTTYSTSKICAKLMRMMKGINLDVNTIHNLAEKFVRN